MNKLLQLIDNFYKLATGLTNITKLGAEDLISEAENFDIKDEGLYNQFESFMSGYQELLDSLKLDPKNLTEDAFENSKELLGTLDTRYKRLITNPYLDLDESSGYDESFNPGDFTEFVNKVFKSAEDKFKDIGLDETEISDLKANQFANEFNKIQVDRGDQNLRFTGDKVRQLLEARRQWYQNIKNIKKIGPSHPEYSRYQNFVASRKRHYENLKSDPVRWEAYREKARVYRKKRYEEAKNKESKLLDLIRNAPDEITKARLLEELKVVDKTLNRAKHVEIAKNLKVQKESGNFSGLLIMLRQNIANVKMGIKKNITKELSNQEDTRFKIYKDKLIAAKESGNSAALEAATKELQAVLNQEANDHPLIRNYDLNARDYQNYISGLKIIDKWMSADITEEMKPVLQNAIEQGEALIKNPITQTSFKSPNNTIQKILHLLKAKV